MKTHSSNERQHAAGDQSALNLYARIVVALDGSARAELVLPYVEALAEQFGSSVTLLRSTTPSEVITAPAIAATMPTLAPNVAATPIDHRAGARARRERDRHDYAWPQRSRTLGLRQHRRGGAAACPLPGVAHTGRRGAWRIRMTYTHTWEKRNRSITTAGTRITGS